METQRPSLADQLAGLRATITSNDDRGWLPASLHALIMACLARIFGRLENLFLLWQSGHLSQLVPARPFPAQPHAEPHARGNTTAPQIRAPQRRSAHAIQAALGAPAQPQAAPPPLPRTLPRNPPSLRPNRAQPPHHSFCFSTPFARHGKPASNLLRYRNYNLTPCPQPAASAITPAVLEMPHE